MVIASTQVESFETYNYNWSHCWGLEGGKRVQRQGRSDPKLTVLKIWQYIFKKEGKSIGDGKFGVQSYLRERNAPEFNKKSSFLVQNKFDFNEQESEFLQFHAKIAKLAHYELCFDFVKLTILVALDHIFKDSYKATCILTKVTKNISLLF